MTAKPDPEKDHVECSISDTYLFTSTFVQSDIESGKYEDIYTGKYEDIYPIIKLEGNRPIEFVNDNASDRFLDLNNSFLKVKCKVTKAGIQNLAEADKFSVITYPVSSLISRVDILFGGKVVSSSTNTYPYTLHEKPYFPGSRISWKAQKDQVNIIFY